MPFGDSRMASTPGRALDRYPKRGSQTSVATGFLRVGQPGLWQYHTYLRAAYNAGKHPATTNRIPKAHGRRTSDRLNKAPAGEQTCGRIVDWRYRGAWLSSITPMLCAKCGVVRMPRSQYAEPKEETVQQHAVPCVLDTSQRHTVIPCRLQMANMSRTTQESSRDMLVVSSRNARCVAIGCDTYIKGGVE